MHMLTSSFYVRTTAAFLAAIILAGCKEETAQQALPKVFVSQRLAREVTGWDGFTGRFEATDTVDVRARVSGLIERVAFRDGAIVKKGNLLFVIDPRPYQAEVTQAEGRLADAQSRLQLADVELGRAKVLIRSEATTTSILDQREQAYRGAQAAVTTAAGALARARLDLEFTDVHAPISGRISRKLVSEGNLVAGGDASATQLTTIVSIDPIDVYFDIDEESYLRYGRLAAAGKRASAGNVGSEVEIVLPDDATPPRKGTPRQEFSSGGSLLRPLRGEVAGACDRHVRRPARSAERVEHAAKRRARYSHIVPPSTV
jgi:multidrug efflux pump subunit AcrA (membrane-fusion protein)